jgi:glycosyltransferase involved in cell wall biosynthesis
MKICHISSLHKSADIRIFTKQCVSLAKSGYDTTLVVNNTKDEVREGVRIKALTKRASVLKRLLVNLPIITFFVIKNRFDIYHAHDPELLPILFILHLIGRNVVYDMHENFPKQLESKEIPRVLKKVLKIVWPKFEMLVLSRINVVYAETSYKKDYLYINNYVDILNMPLDSHLKRVACDKHNLFSIGYVGGVSEDRYCLKILEVLKTLQNKGVKIRFDCVGPVCNKHTQNAIDSLRGVLNDTHYHGFLPPKEAWKVIAKCHVGLAVLMPIPNYIESYPTKMFEYLAMGLPVITSDFELYKPIIEGGNVGVCVNPLNTEELESALMSLMEDPLKFESMQERTTTILEGKYSWNIEFEKMSTFYKAIHVK